MRKSRTPAGFVPKPLRNRSRKNAETSLLEPTKNKEKTKKYSALAMRNRSQKNAETLLLETTQNKEKSCLKQGKPLRNVRLESPQATRQNPWKTWDAHATFGTHKKQSFGNRCRQPSRKACARCRWRSGSQNYDKPPLCQVNRGHESRFWRHARETIK